MAAELTAAAEPRVAVDLPPQTAALRHPAAQVLLPLLAVGGALLLLRPALQPVDVIGAALPGGRVLFLLAGASMLLAAPVAARHHPSPLFPWAILVAGAVSWAPVLLGSPAPAAFTAGAALQHLPGVLIFWSAFGAPYNKLGTPGVRAIVAVALFGTVLAGAVVAMGADPTLLGCPACPRSANLLADLPSVGSPLVLRGVASA